jgi:ectoine hydroxylase-related dioxygenase (phytanoyl-CoA dioxygenase family)
MSSCTITPEQVKQFQEEGYFILERVIPEAQLDALRRECGKFIHEFDEFYANNKDKQTTNHTTANVSKKELEEACKKVAFYKLPFNLDDVRLIRPETTERELQELDSITPLPRNLYELNNSIGISHPGKRYFISFKALSSSVLHDFVFGKIMQEICSNTIGKDACLFLEQFVVKGPEVGMKFGWHQDSGYVPFEHKPYVTCWVALDDMSESNGTIYVTPFSKDPDSKRGVLPHHKEAGTNDMMCYSTDTPLTKGTPMIVPAGSIVVFSSLAPHSSGANQTTNMRRAYIVQYSAEPINARGDGELRNLSGPRHFADPVFA